MLFSQLLGDNAGVSVPCVCSSDEVFGNWSWNVRAIAGHQHGVLVYPL